MTAPGLMRAQRVGALRCPHRLATELDGNNAEVESARLEQHCLDRGTGLALIGVRFAPRAQRIAV